MSEQIATKVLPSLAPEENVTACETIPVTDLPCQAPEENEYTSSSQSDPDVGSEPPDSAERKALRATDSADLTSKRPRAIIYKVQYDNFGTHETVYKAEVGSGEFCQSASDPESVLEFVQVNFTFRNAKWKENELPPKYGTGTSYIRIFSETVISALRYVVEYYSGQNLTGAYVDIQEPYAVVWHHEDALEQYRQKFAPDSEAEKDASGTCPNRHAYEHVGTLLDFVRSQNGAAVNEERKRHSEGLKKSSMSWLLFKPGMDVYWDRERKGEYEPYVFHRMNLSFRDGKLGLCTYDLWRLVGFQNRVIPCREHGTPISADDVSGIEHGDLVPCEYFERNDEMKLMGKTGKELRKHFEHRGEKFYQLKMKGCYDYDGITRTQPIGTYTGQVMVDPKQFEADSEHFPWDDMDILTTTLTRAIAPLTICTCGRCEKTVNNVEKNARFSSYSELSPLVTPELSGHQYFLCEGTTEAFLFKRREWATLDVLGFKDPVFDGNIMKTLVLEEETKLLITNLTKRFVHNLVANSTQESNKEAVTSEKDTGKILKKEEPSPTKEAVSWSADFVKGKGEGLIFLLHGKPGVGKTYTAECVAAHTERPLLSLTCADIGTDPEKVETQLRRWFKIAKNWGAIMLIDEADIYMEHREVQDLTRNNLVAGFLRALEYYQGIVFLTTNRVGTFDEAFISRIHVMIHYKPFTDKERNEVWENFFEKLEKEEDENMKILESTRDYVASREVQDLNWNGREIRNAFQIAVALAQTEEDRDKRGRIQIKREHIGSTVRMSKNFKDYLKSLYKKDETQRAVMMGNRYDAFGQEAQAERTYK